MTYSLMLAEPRHIEAMNALSRQKRQVYAKYQPQFWKAAGSVGELAQKEWFAKLLEDEHYVCLVAENGAHLLGFVIGKILPAPEVYDPGGLTLMIDDFCVAEGDWDGVGKGLLQGLERLVHDRGVAQMVVVSGVQDLNKKAFLSQEGLVPASTWFVKPLT